MYSKRLLLHTFRGETCLILTDLLNVLGSMIRVIRNESTCLCLTFLTELGVGGICLYIVLLVTASRLLDTLALLVILLLLFGGVAPDIFWVIVNLTTFKLLCLRLEAVL